MDESVLRCFAVICFLLFNSYSCGQRIRDQIYSPLNGGAFCFRRLNGTHQVGCSSSNGGNLGVLQIVESATDAAWIADNGTAGPYVALLSIGHSNNILPLLIQNYHNLAGVIIYDNGTHRPDHLSHESRCPNEYSASSGAQCSSSGHDDEVWNPFGSGLFQRDIPFPIYYIPAEQQNQTIELLNCYNRFNAHNRESQSSRPLCNVQMSAFMFAAVNSEVCYRRSQLLSMLSSSRVCDPLSDKNVYAAHYPRKNTTVAGNETVSSVEPPNSVTLVTARLDSTSLFDGQSPGAASTVVGLCTLLVTAHVLTQVLPPHQMETYKQNVIWALFNGEAYDYIGSQRVGVDMDQGSWPPRPHLALRPEAVRLHLEVGQLGGALHAPEEWPLSVFTPEYGSDGNQKVEDFFRLLKESDKNSALNFSLIRSDSMPSSSLHSLRRVLGPSALAQALLADHGPSYTNRYYHSLLDDSDNVAYKYHNLTIGADGTFMSTMQLINSGEMSATTMQVRVARLATTLARTLYQSITGVEYQGDYAASAHMVDEILYCFLKSSLCKAFTATYPTNLYTDVESTVSSSDETPTTLTPDSTTTTPSTTASPVTLATPVVPPLPLYVGVAPSPGVAYAAGRLLALLTGTPVFNITDKANCVSPLPDEETYHTYHWMLGWNASGVCMESGVNYTLAISPAFTEPDYDFSSGKFSTWTESVWTGMSARIFVRGTGAGTAWAFGTGVPVTILVAMVTGWLRAKADVVFASPAEDSEVVTTEEEDPQEVQA